MQAASQSLKVIERAHLEELFKHLKTLGYELIGPTVQNSIITYDTITGVDDLPCGWTDEQEGGHYRLKRRQDEALFGYVVGPHSWKQFLFPPFQTLFRARRNGEQIDFEPTTEDPPQRAFIGVRSCELHAIAIQDQVFTGGRYVDSTYQARRDNILVIAVNCGEAGRTCFCVSMETGPKATFGFDLALTEILDVDQHYFTVEIGTARGESILQALPHREAESAEQEAAAAASANAANQMGRELDTHGIKELLYRNLEHPRWQEVADRCLSCANCTMVCPTCFCSTVEDTTDLTGEEAQRVRRWDSCFNQDFSYLAGGSVRGSTLSRYRQWMTHKLATWYDQFGSSGCVGCGRCITWCPVGIDITEEVRAIRASEEDDTT